MSALWGRFREKGLAHLLRAIEMYIVLAFMAINYKFSALQLQLILRFSLRRKHGNFRLLEKLKS